MNAYSCILFKYLCPSFPVLHATALRNLASSFAAALPCISRTLSTISKKARRMADEHKYDAQLNCMHPIVHEHLVHTEVRDHPKRIENQMCTTSLKLMIFPE